MVKFKIKNIPTRKKTFDNKEFSFIGNSKQGRALTQRKKLLKERGKSVRTVKYKENLSSVYIK